MFLDIQSAANCDGPMRAKLNASFTFIYPLAARVIGAPHMTSQPVSSTFLCSPLSSGTWRTPGLSIPDVVIAPLFSCLSCLLPLPLCLAILFLAGPHEGETCSYHFSLRFFTTVRRSSCGPNACWILAQTSMLVTWSLYEMRGILR